MSILNLGAGFAAAGETIAKTAGAMSLEALRSDLEEQRTRLAAELAEGAASRGRAETHGYAKELQEASQAFQKPKQQSDIELQQQQIAASKSGVGLAEEAARRKNTAGEAINTMLMGTAPASGTAPKAATTDEQKAFFEKIRPWAEAASQKTGVDVKVIMAQAALESGYGKAAPGNAYFGVKGTPGAPNTQMLDTTEAGPGGETYKTKAPFRSYASPAESFDDYAKFINENGNYRDMRSAKDLESQIAALGKSGYATDPQYAQKVGAIARSIDATPPAGQTPPASRSSALAQLPNEVRAAIAQVAQHDPDKAMTMLLGALDRQKKEDAWAPLSADAAKAALGSAYDPSKAYQINRVGGKIEPIGGSLVNIQNQGESEALKAQIQSANKVNVELQENSAKARNGLAQVTRLDNLLSEMSTGKFTESTQNIKQIAKGIGIDLEGMGIKDDTGQAQAAAALSKQLALALRDPSSGGGMPGAMSDADREYLNKMIPTLETTPEGRKLMIEYTKKMYQRSIDVAKIANEYSRTPEFRSDPNGLYAKLQEYADNNPLFARESGGSATEPEANASGFGARGGPAGAAGTPRPADKAAYDALPSGTVYMYTDGTMRRKP